MLYPRRIHGLQLAIWWQQQPLSSFLSLLALLRAVSHTRILNTALEGGGADDFSLSMRLHFLNFEAT